MTTRDQMALALRGDRERLESLKATMARPRRPRGEGKCFACGAPTRFGLCADCGPVNARFEGVLPPRSAGYAIRPADAAPSEGRKRGKGDA
jgi:hypothetical protein